MVRWTTCEEYSLTGLRSREGTQRGLEPGSGLIQLQALEEA